MSLYELKTLEAVIPLYDFKWLHNIYFSKETMNSIKIFILLNDNRLKYIL